MNEVPAVLWSYIEGLKAHDFERIAGIVAADLAFVTARATFKRPNLLLLDLGRLARILNQPARPVRMPVSA